MKSYAKRVGYSDAEKLDPNSFHFMRFVCCPDVGVECLGCGEVKLKVEVIRRDRVQKDAN